jgi:hypothetical protein
MMKKQRQRRPTRQLRSNSDGRDERGRFRAGNELSRGNGGQRDRSRIRRALAAAVTDEDLSAVVRKAIAQARNGDRHARSWLSDRLAGTPRREQLDVQAVQLGALDSLEDVRAAAARVATAAAAGTLTIEAAKLLAQQLHTLAELHIATDLAARIEDVEQRVGVTRP